MKILHVQLTLPLEPPLSYKLKLTEFDETLSKSRVSRADFGTEFGF